MIRPTTSWWSGSCNARYTLHLSVPALLQAKALFKLMTLSIGIGLQGSSIRQSTLCSAHFLLDGAGQTRKLLNGGASAQAFAGAFSGGQPSAISQAMAQAFSSGTAGGQGFAQATATAFAQARSSGQTSAFAQSYASALASSQTQSAASAIASANSGGS